MIQSGRDASLRNLTARRIAVIKPSALGDVVQALPLLPVLRARFPAARLTWVIQRELQDLVSDHPSLDEMICVDRRPTAGQVVRLCRQLRGREFDLVFDLQGLLRSAVLTLATGALWRVGLETAREGASLATNCVIPDSGREIPAHARYWRVAEALGMGTHPREVWLTLSAADNLRAVDWLRRLPRPVLAVQWGAKWVTKRWPLAGFAEVLSRAGRAWGGSLVIVGGRSERPECDWLTEKLAETVGRSSVLNLAGQTSIKQLAAVLSRVDAVVSNDSGPLHLAAELGRPTLGIFTCTSAVRSGPPGTQHEFVSTQVPCAASYCKVCPHTGTRHMACHQELTVERVWQGLERLVAKHELAPQIRRFAA